MTLEQVMLQFDTLFYHESPKVKKSIRDLVESAYNEGYKQAAKDCAHAWSDYPGGPMDGPLIKHFKD